MTFQGIQKTKESESKDNLIMSTVEDGNDHSLTRNILSNQFYFKQLSDDEKSLQKENITLFELDQENDDIQSNIMIMLEEIEKIHDKQGSDLTTLQEINQNRQMEIQKVTLFQGFKVIEKMVELLREKTKVVLVLAKILKTKNLEIKEMTGQLNVQREKLDKYQNNRSTLSLQSSLSYQFQGIQSSKFQSELTQSADTLPIMNELDFESNKSLFTYIQSLSNVTKDVFYDEKLIRELENLTENNLLFKAIARLLKEHNSLKMCLDEMFKREQEQQNTNNDRVLELFAKKHQKRESQKKSECRIF